MGATYLVLGGGGMVGYEVARRIVHDLAPSKVVVGALTQAEVDATLERLRAECLDGTVVVGEPGDVFLPTDLAHRPRHTVVEDPEGRRRVMHDLYGPVDDAYRDAHLADIIRRHRPEVIVDAINTATAISYQDVAAAAAIARDDADRVAAGEVDDPERVACDVQSLILSLEVPQLVRHALILHRAMVEAGTRLYIKVGTTGAGGMGLNVPYTHSEDRPSAKLLGKTAVGFAHTGLLFLMARTPGGPVVKEVKPGALIGYRAVERRTITERGETVWCYRSRREPLGDRLVMRHDPADFERCVEVQLPVVDTGENGVFTKSEFETITELGQMELVTPEEVASVCLREIAGVNTGHDMIAAVNSAIMDPSYRGGVLRSRVLRRLERLEEETGTHSVALGQLGPPELSKLLWEAELLALVKGTVPAVLHADPDELSRLATEALDHRPDLCDTICSLGIPVLEADGATLRRGPRIRIPEVIGDDGAPMSPAERDRWAAKGWVDLRPENWARWQARLAAIAADQPDKADSGSAAVTVGSSDTDTIRPGTIVAWILAHEMGGHRAA